MADTFRCDRGHEWQSATADTPRDTPATCPECGGVGELRDAMDELPPPPSTRSVPVDWARPPGPPAIDGYDVGELVGRGGMAVVYKARQRSLNRPVALKMLLVGPYMDTDEAARIRAEAEAIARLQHPNVVHVYEVGQRDGRPYLLMEYVDGGTLADRIKLGPIPPEQAVVWAEAIARGVHAAHRRGVVHRDLKPANVLMTTDGVPKITDFGIARRLDDPTDKTRTGLVVGTPAYMAPEQAEGRSGVGPPADIWAVGTILYEMLTGRRPFEGESSQHLLRRVTTEAPVRPSRVRPGVPAALEAICLKCLEKEPARRYPTAEALADDLARYRSGTLPERPSRPRWIIPAAIAAGVLVVSFGVWRITGGQTKTDDPTPPGPGPAGNGVAATTGTTAATTGGSGPPPVEPDVGVPSWEPFTIAAGADGFQQIAFSNRDTGYAASRSGVYRTDDGGQNWTRRSERPLGHVHVLTFTDPDHGWLGSDQLYQTRDGAKSWEPVALPVTTRDIRALALGPGGWGLASGLSATGEPTLFRRSAGGADWVRIDPMAWDGPERPHRNWIPGGLAVAGPKDGWAVLFGVSEEGIVLHTADGGVTWTTRWRANADAYHVHFADANNGWLAGSRGKLWSTLDGGHTWKAQANPAGTDTVDALAFIGGGSFGLAPLPNGKALVTHGTDWRVSQTGLSESKKSAAVVDRGRAYVLGQDGQGARYIDPQFRPPK